MVIKSTKIILIIAPVLGTILKRVQTVIPVIADDNKIVETEQIADLIIEISILITIRPLLLNKIYFSI